MRFISAIALSVLFLACGASAASAHSKCNLNQLADRVYRKIIENSHLANIDSMAYFDDQSKLISVLFSIDTHRSRLLLVKLSDFYLGESVGEILTEALTRGGKEMQRDLILALKRPSACVPKKFKCHDRKAFIDETLNYLKAGKVFQSDTKPMPTYRLEKVCTVGEPELRRSPDKLQ